MRRARPYVVCALFYGLVALLAYGTAFPGDPHRYIPGSDPTLDMWFLTWTPFAILHGLNPLHTTLLNYPVGINVGQNTQMPLLGILTWPVTYFFGPVATWNLVAWSAFPLSGLSMFAVLRKWSCSAIAAGIGGLIYSFSPYMVGQGLGHLNLLFVPLPPLIFFGLSRLFVSREHSWRWALVTTGASLCQLLISSEVLATTAIVAVAAAALLAVTKLGQVLPVLRQVAAPVTVSLLLFAAMVSYPVWYVVGGPHHFRGPVWGYSTQLHSDLLGPLIPSDLQSLYPKSLRTIGSRFVGGSLSENGTYVGLPMLFAIGYLGMRIRRNAWFAFAIAMTVISFVLSLGDRLVIDSHATSIYLPLHLLTRVPVLQDIIPSRFSLYEYLFIAIALALGVTELQGRFARVEQQARSSLSLRRLIGVGLAATVVVLSLLPNWPYRTVPVDTPSLFKSHQSPAVPVLSGAVLTYPYPLYSNDVAMLWQADSLMRFSLLGGYALTGRPRGATVLPARLRPVAVQALFASDSTISYFPLRDPPALSTISPSQVRAFIRNNDVSAIVIETAEPGASALAVLVRAAVGSPRSIDGFEVWTGLQSFVNPP